MQSRELTQCADCGFSGASNAEGRACQSCSDVRRKLTRSMSSRYWPNSAIRRRRRTCAIACVIRYAATRAVFSLHNRQARSSAWFAPNSSHVFHTARRFAGSLVSSSRRSIVARVSVKSFLPGRPISHAKIIAQALRSPVRSIVSTRTGSTSGSDSPEPRSDSSRPYKQRGDIVAAGLTARSRRNPATCAVRGCNGSIRSPRRRSRAAGREF
jgi:hypothetical protein